MSENGKRSWRGRIAAVAVSTIIGFLLIEVFLRIFMPIYQTSILEAYEYDAELGTKLKPGIHLFETTDYQDEIKTNKLGTSNFQENWEAYETLVLAAGDSYTQGTGLPADMSYPAQLELTLNTDAEGGYSPKFGVVNIGVPGYGGEQSIIAIRRWWDAAPIKPRFILYMGCDNDYEDDVLFRSGYRHNHLVDGNPKWGSLVKPLQWVTSDLQIAIRMKIALGKMRRSAIGVSDGATADASAAGPTVAELERSVLERLKTFAAEKNAVLILGWSDQGRAYEWAKNWAAENNIEFADWASNVGAVRELSPDIPIDNQHSGGHHRGWVNRLIAERFAAAIRSGGNK